MSAELTTELESSDNGVSALTAIGSSRAMQEVQAAMIVAKRFPRDENKAVVKILNACKRKGLAEAAVYSYPRGNETVDGPSIRLAECMAQAWGNLDFGIVELEQRFGESSCMAYCWDLETNTRQTKIFTIKHERHTRSGKKFLTDPRDVYEIVANQGARRMRACILGVIPGDIVDSALEEVNKTLKAAGGGVPLADRVRKMVVAFDGMGVKTTHIEKLLSHNLDCITEAELVKLGKIHNSIRDQMSTRESWFDIEGADKPKGSKVKTKTLDDVTGSKQPHATPEQTDAARAEAEAIAREKAEIEAEEAGQ